MKITQRDGARQIMNVDVILLGAVLCLASLGLIMVMSASGIMAPRQSLPRQAL